MRCSTSGRLRRAAPGILGAVLVLVAAALPGCTPGPATSEENDPHIQAGKLQRSSGFYAEAEEAFHRALQNNPRSAAAHYQLGLLYYTEMTNYASALHHFERYRGLQPKRANDDVLKLMIVECKREVAKDVPLGSIGMQQQLEIKRLKDTNALLSLQIEQLKLQLAQRPPAIPPGRAATNAAAPDVVDRATPLASAGRLTAPPASATNAPAPATNASATVPRTHVVKPGETLAAIARRYKVELSTVVAANPAIDPRRLQPGQTVKVPGP